MSRIRLMVLLLLVGCGTPPFAPDQVTTTHEATGNSSPSTTVVATSIEATTTSSEPVTTTSLAAARDTGGAFPECAMLPTMFDVVEILALPDGTQVDPVTGEPVRIFDLAEIAGVPTYRFRSDLPVALSGEYMDGVTRYVMDDPSEWGAEWLVGPGTQTLILGDEGWGSPRELTITPWLWSEPTIIYMHSMLALPESTFERWEVVEGREVGVFLGGPAAVAALSERGESEPGSSVEFWLSTDCYPVRFSIFEDGTQVHHWELFDLGADVDFELPPEWEG